MNRLKELVDDCKRIDEKMESIWDSLPPETDPEVLKNLKAKITAYKGIIITNVLATKSDENCTLSVDHPNHIGQTIHDTENYLGVSKEAIKAMESIPGAGDDVGEVDWFESNDGQWNFGWMGPPKRLINPKTAESSNTWKGPQKHKCVIIENEVPEEAKKTIDKGQIKEMFHTLWTKAVGTPDYDKEEWKELSLMLYKEGIEV